MQIKKVGLNWVIFKGRKIVEVFDTYWEAMQAMGLMEFDKNRKYISMYDVEHGKKPKDEFESWRA